jgi:PAS domain-containing protein
MLDALRIGGDFVGLLTFAVAFLMLAATPASRANARFQPAVKGLMLAALGVYVIVTASDVMAHLNIAILPPTIEDYAETLFPVIVLGVVFAADSAQQTYDVARAQVALGHANDLMLGVVDAAPAGIMFLSSNGQITFANETAKHVLDLVDHPETAAVITPGWVVEGQQDAEPGVLRILVRSEPYEGLPLTLRWPTGWRIELRVAGRPLADATGELGGVVVTFELPSLRPETAG